MSREVKVSVLPPCDFCADGTLASYDARMKAGPGAGHWANVCEGHFTAYQCTLGTGSGQRLVLTKLEG